MRTRYPKRRAASASSARRHTVTGGARPPVGCTQRDQLVRPNTTFTRTRQCDSDAVQHGLAERQRGVVEVGGDDRHPGGRRRRLTAPRSQ